MTLKYLISLSTSGLLTANKKRLRGFSPNTVEPLIPAVEREVRHCMDNLETIQSEPFRERLVRVSKELSYVSQQTLVERLHTDVDFRNDVLLVLRRNKLLQSALEEALPTPARKMRARRSKVPRHMRQRKSKHHARRVADGRLLIPSLATEHYAQGFLKKLDAHNAVVARSYTEDEYSGISVDGHRSADVPAIEQTIVETLALIDKSV